MEAQNRKVVVAQKGARRHYLVPRAFHAQGMLAALVTDLYAPPMDSRTQRLLTNCSPKPVRRILGRRAEDLPDDRVCSCALRHLGWSLEGRARARRGGPYAADLIVDRAFASWVVELDLPSHEVFFGFSYASLEVLQAEKERGIFTILEQFDAAGSHYRLLRQEAMKWPDYAPMPSPVPPAYLDRVRQEWDVADVVIANSDWTREALLEQGVPCCKIEVNPLAYELSQPADTEDRPKPASHLRVLWVGTVNIGKGIPYLVEAARMLEGKPVEFTVAGPLAIKPESVSKAPSNIRWLGPVPRTEVAALYRSHHIFVLPTISDGFAITQLEALTHGLPVIVTPNCAHIVEDGKTGFVVPAFSSEAVAEAILRFIEDPALVERMSPCCIEVAKQYSIETYASRLVEIIESRIGVSA